MDHAANEEVSDFTSFKQTAESQCIALRDIRALANGIKHPGNSWPILGTMLEFQEAQFTWDQAQITWDQAKNALSIPQDTTDSVKSVPVLVVEALAYWNAYFTGSSTTLQPT